MKFLIIHGSPRKGNTWKLVELVKEGMLKHGPVDFEEVMLLSTEIPACRGCNTCFVAGGEKCPHAGGIQHLVDKMMQADGLIFTSPVYALNVSGLVKTFFDHTAFFYHRPPFFAKKALVIVSTAGGGAGKTAGYMRDNLKHWGCNRVYTLAVQCFDLNYKPSEKIKSKCLKLAEKFYNDVNSGRLYPPNLKRLMLYNMWRAMSLTWSDEAAPDKAYWRNTGLINHSFSPEVRIGVFRKAVGNLFFKLFRAMFKV